jgi:hypothetical protein
MLPQTCCASGQQLPLQQALVPQLAAVQVQVPLAQT